MAKALPEPLEPADDGVYCAFSQVLDYTHGHGKVVYDYLAEG